jgi:hypothetical protein
MNEFIVFVIKFKYEFNSLSFLLIYLYKYFIDNGNSNVFNNSLKYSLSKYFIFILFLIFSITFFLKNFLPLK